MSSNYNHLDPSNPGAGSSSDKSSDGELEVYRFVMFCVPILLTFVLLFLFYLFYLRPRRVNWSSLRMRTTSPSDNQHQFFPEVESGLKKEVRELLPIIVFNESFCVRDTQCSVCLGDYEPEDKLQQIPACSHTFHMDCIDSWLSTHTTCPLCRLSLLASAKSQTRLSNQNSPPPSVAENASSHSQSSLQQSSVRVVDSGALETAITVQGTANENGERSLRMQCKGRGSREKPKTGHETTQF